jgi:phosphoribosylglycinamide formyltransferase 1
VHGRGGIEVAAVASNKPDAMALERAARAGIETAVFERGAYSDREARDRAIGDWLAERAIDLIVLAGYMELLSASFVERFRGRIINVHPALLPSFPGVDSVQQALDHGVKVTGVTVHFVDEGVDSGPIILQRAVEVPGSRHWADLEERIHAVEHELLPRTIELIAAGAVRIEERNPRLVSIDRELAT